MTSAIGAFLPPQRPRPLGLLIQPPFPRILPRANTPPLSIIYARERNIPTFIIFGIGGTPSAPEEVIIAPLEKLQKPFVKEKYLRSLHHHDLSRTLYYYAKDKRLM